MAWILIICSLVVLWIASLVKILHSPSSHSNDVFRANGSRSGDVRSKRNVLLVVAHPDDESMFFSPTISYLTSRGYNNVRILCLSFGNADGKGNIRKQELYRACAVLKVPVQQVKSLDHPDLQDGFGKVWDHTLLAKIIREEVVSHGIDVVIVIIAMLIMEYGVSCSIVPTKTSKPGNFGPMDVWLSYLCAKRCSDEAMRCFVNESPRISFLAMAQHSSQWVWFRKLFVAFSSYSYVNTLRRIN